MRWSSVSESERTFDGPIFSIAREDTDFGLPFGHVARGSSRGGGILSTLHNTFERMVPGLGGGKSFVLHFPLSLRLSAFLVRLLAPTTRLCGRAELQSLWEVERSYYSNYERPSFVTPREGLTFYEVPLRSARARPRSAARPTHLKRVARIANYTFKAATLLGPQGEGPGSGGACGDGCSSRGVVATTRVRSAWVAYGRWVSSLKAL